MDKMREEFEIYYRKKCVSDGMHPHDLASEFEVCDDGDYVYFGAKMAWHAWKASRAALCVEFPKQPKRIFAFDDGAFQVVKQFESCGIDVKNKPRWAIKLLESDKNKPLA